VAVREEIMREPTAKERAILIRCLEGLQEDVQAVTQEAPSLDVHGTMNANLHAMLAILGRLKTED
jgi:hypothetical protein